ncbi:hypothetical protein CANARDRAFT_190328, partial [[Candida] arabinofermentans NRRL YB-2248]
MARPSAIYRASQPTTITRNTKYQFPILETSDITSLCSRLGLEFINEEIITRPTKSFMKSLIEQVMDKFLFVSPYSLRQSIESIESNDDNELNNIKNTMNIIASQRIMYKFLSDCGFDDFSLKDVLKPESIRVKIILSSLINYARFREERLDDCSELFESNETLIYEYKEALKLNNHIKLKLKETNSKILKNNLNLNKINENISNSQLELKNLNENQKLLTTEHSKYKLEKNSLIKDLENQNSLFIEIKKELDRLKPFIKESPETVVEIIQLLKNSLKLEEDKLHEFELKSKKISISIDSFQYLTHIFNDLHIQLDSLQDQLQKLDDLKDSIDSIELNLNKKLIEFDNLNKNLNQLTKYIELNNEKLLNSKQNYNDKLKIIDNKIETSRNDLSNLKSKIHKDSIDLNLKKSQTDSLKRSLLDLQSKFEIGCKNASIELNKLNSQLVLYIDEMNK